MISQTINMDCKIGMQEWPNQHFGLAIPDPPYFTGPESGKFYGARTSTIKVTRPSYQRTKWELPTDLFFDQLYRISDNQIIWGGNYFPQLGTPHTTPRRPELVQWINEHPKGWIVWDKVNTASSFNDFELAWTSFDMPTVIYQFMWSGMMQGKSMTEGHIMQGNKKLNEKRIHQTQKPQALYHWQYLNYANKSKPILDTHLGSQSSRIVAYKMGFDFIGYEISEHYFNTGNARFDHELGLFKQNI